MANRAYLYFTDDVSALTYENHWKRRDGNEREYLDSRHQVPLAWFLFFDSASVHLEELQAGAFKYHDVYLRREWTKAKADFVRRAPLFLSWFEGEYGQHDVDVFLSQLDSLSPDGPFLSA